MCNFGESTWLCQSFHASPPTRSSPSNKDTKCLRSQFFHAWCALSIVISRPVLLFEGTIDGSLLISAINLSWPEVPLYSVPFSTTLRSWVPMSCQGSAPHLLLNAKIIQPLGISILFCGSGKVYVASSTFLGLGSTMSAYPWSFCPSWPSAPFFSRPSHCDNAGYARKKLKAIGHLHNPGNGNSTSIVLYVIF